MSETCHLCPELAELLGYAVDHNCYVHKWYAQRKSKGRKAGPIDVEALKTRIVENNWVLDPITDSIPYASEQVDNVFKGL
jgi:hypothetical protein